MGDAGSEQSQQSSSFNDAGKCAAEFNALSDDSQLNAVLAAWPTLNAAVKSDIVRLVETSADASQRVE